MHEKNKMRYITGTEFSYLIYYNKTFSDVPQRYLKIKSDGLIKELNAVSDMVLLSTPRSFTFMIKSEEEFKEVKD